MAFLCASNVPERRKTQKTIYKVCSGKIERKSIIRVVAKFRGGWWHCMSSEHRLRNIFVLDKIASLGG